MRAKVSQTPTWDEIAETFLAALELSPGSRGPWLDAACGGRLELRRQVEEMLAAHEHPRPLAIEERLLAAGIEAGDGPARRVGERVGPYRLVRLLGRGGMGEVHLAERADGEYRGQVAIKFLAGDVGLLGRGERERRLRRERQILASLRHPGIAALYDGGITGDGQPYLVMEHVDGRPITEHCDERRLDLRERLELFTGVCDAVQYAHARLVVHRDLKPSNLLVTADGASKLLDFGIAKLLDPAGTAGAEPPYAGADATRAEVRVFTPRRAAPEQVRGEPVTTATDVFGLGVLLFELLTGELPFRTMGSDRRSGEHGASEEEPPRLPRALHGDFEAILAKALAPRPEDRYAAAGFLAEDVRRHLAGEPVRARRQTWAYRGRRFVRRHAVPVAALALAAAALLAAALFAAGQARRAARERDLALAGEQRAKAAMDSLVDLLGMIEPEAADREAGSGPSGGSPGGDRIAVADLLDRAERRALALDEPEVAARLLYVLGRIQRQRTDHRAAERLLTAARARGARAPVPAGDGLLGDVEFELGLALRELGEKERARELMTGVLESRRALYGDRHADVFTATLELLQMEPPAVARPRLERLLAEERAALPPGTVTEAATLNALGAMCFHLGDRAAARRHFAAAAAILAKAGSAARPFELAALGNLAVLLDDPRRQEEIHRGRIEAASAIYGSGSTYVATAWTNLGVALTLQGRHAEAEAAFRRGHGIFTARLGAGHVETASALRNVGRAQQLQGRYPEALATLRAAVATLGVRGEPRAAAGIRYQAASVAWLVEHSPEALAELRSATRTLTDLSNGPHDPYPANAMVALGITLLEAARPREAAEVLQEALDRRRATGREPDEEMEARCALRLAQQAGGMTSDPHELRACAEALPGWGLADPELVARLARWRG